MSSINSGLANKSTAIESKGMDEKLHFIENYAGRPSH